MMGESELVEANAIREAFLTWCLARADYEVAHNLSLFRSVKGMMPLCFVEATRGWSPREQRALLCARTKRYWQRLLAPLAFTSEEERVLELFEYPPSRSPVLSEMAERAMKGEFDIGIRRLRAEVCQQLEKVLGKPATKSTKSVRYLSMVAGVTVYTDVDFDGRSFQLRYCHHVVSGLASHDVGLLSERMILRGVSMASCLGPGEIAWAYMTDEDIPATCELLARLCTEFISELSRIVESACARSTGHLPTIEQGMHAHRQ